MQNCKCHMRANFPWQVITVYLENSNLCVIWNGFLKSIHIEYPTHIYPCRRVYHKVLM